MRGGPVGAGAEPLFLSARLFPKVHGLSPLGSSESSLVQGVQGRVYGHCQRRHANRKGEIRRGFQGVGEPGLVGQKKKRFGPIGPRARVQAGPDESPLWLGALR